MVGIEATVEKLEEIWYVGFMFMGYRIFGREEEGTQS